MKPKKVEKKSGLVFAYGVFRRVEKLQELIAESIQWAPGDLEALEERQDYWLQEIRDAEEGGKSDMAEDPMSQYQRALLDLIKRGKGGKGGEGLRLLVRTRYEGAAVAERQASAKSALALASYYGGRSPNAASFYLGVANTVDGDLGADGLGLRFNKALEDLTRQYPPPASEAQKGAVDRGQLEVELADAMRDPEPASKTESGVGFRDDDADFRGRPEEGTEMGEPEPASKTESGVDFRDGDADFRGGREEGTEMGEPEPAPETESGAGFRDDAEGKKGGLLHANHVLRTREEAKKRFAIIARKNILGVSDDLEALEERQDYWLQEIRDAEEGGKFGMAEDPMSQYQRALLDFVKRGKGVKGLRLLADTQDKKETVAERQARAKSALALASGYDGRKPEAASFYLGVANTVEGDLRADGLGSRFNEALEDLTRQYPQPAPEAQKGAVDLEHLEAELADAMRDPPPESVRDLPPESATRVLRDDLPPESVRDLPPESATRVLRVTKRGSRGGDRGDGLEEGTEMGEVKPVGPE